MDFVLPDQDGAVTVADVHGTATDVPWTSLESRQPNSTRGPLSRRQVRDVVEFLASQQQP